ncbi:MAG: HIT family protein [Candidatus Pacebacteria bacterium]|nr:HIT family protein [Candidatus Paceibacterota bacterium]
MEDCIFCKIIKGEIPAYKIYEDDLVLAFLDIHPVAKGHTLIIPKVHARDIFEIDGKTLERIASVSKKVSLKMKENLGVEAVNLYHASGNEAEQTVFHFHLHVIPRKAGDSINFTRAASGKDNFSDNFSETSDKLKIGG